MLDRNALTESSQSLPKLGPGLSQLGAGPSQVATEAMGAGTKEQKQEAVPLGSNFHRCLPLIFDYLVKDPLWENSAWSVHIKASASLLSK